MQIPDGFNRLSDCCVEFSVTQVSSELPDVLNRARDAEMQVEDIAINSPTLQAVFLHFTGRELRE